MDQKYRGRSTYSNTLPPIPIEAVAGTPISYAVGGIPYGGGGTYELFMTVEELQ